LDGFLAHGFWVDPRFGFRGVFDLAEHAAVALAAAGCLSSPILAFRTMTFWTFKHTSF
jgi:hypothetical protein